MSAWRLNRRGILLKEGGRAASFTWLFPRSFFFMIAVPKGWLYLMLGSAWTHPQRIARQVFGPVWFRESGDTA